MSDTKPAVDAVPNRLPMVAVRPPAERLGVAVVRQLADVIVTGALSTGDLLPPEGALSAQFGVSRTVIRESVKRLEEKGLVTVAQGAGTRVTDPTEWNLLDPVVLGAMIDHDDALGILDEVSKTRAALEAAMAADAAGRVDAASIRELQLELQEMIDRIDDIEHFAAADRRFHAIVMRMSGGRLAPSIARTLFNRALESSRYHGGAPADAHAVTIVAHQRILDAIIAEDPAEASDAMFDHIEGSWQSRRLPTPGRD